MKTSRAHRILKEALKHAVRWQLAGTNPADSVEAPKPQRSEILVLSSTEVERLMREADTAR